MKFKVGDRVRCFYNDNGTDQYVGEEGEITAINTSKSVHPYYCSFGGSVGTSFGEHELELISNNMNLREKMALVFKNEPEKSFIKAGVMNPDETLTSDGQAIFLAWLLKENGDNFKKDVVDPILAEKETE